MKIYFAVAAVVAALAGCATAPNGIPLQGGDERGKAVRSVAIDPVAFSGLPWSDSIQKGRFVTVLATFPRTPQSFAEWDPMRIRYQAHAVGKDGREYTAHAVFAGFIGCEPRFIVIVEGVTDPDADASVVTLSTLLTRAYDLNGLEIAGFDAAKFQTDGSYRAEFVRGSGTLLGAVRQMAGFRRAMDGWTVYGTKTGKIISPFKEGQVRDLAAINPQYGYWQKFLGSTSGYVGMDYVSTTVSLFAELVSAGQVRPQGFDYDSKFTRMAYGYNMAVWEELRRNDRSCRGRYAAMQQTIHGRRSLSGKEKELK